MPTIKRRNVLTLLPLTAMGLGLAACADNPKNAKGSASGSGAPQDGVRGVSRTGGVFLPVSR